ncbi:hypothetical protein IJG12_01885 [Candidatus Saccharibacteria bacterium]|nr:hypothetical protein [Candidatus Saccharibacteria bacterium]
MLIPLILLLALIIQILPIVLIVLVVQRKVKKRKEKKQAQIAIVDNSLKEKINQEILAELEKSDPDYNKLKELRAQMDNLPEVPTNSVFNESPKTEQNTDLNSLSVALFVGSLLILAGIGGLVFSGVRELGLILLVLMTIVFYGGGLFIRKIDSLKIVSYVFVGTGMMILPFIGILVHEITKIDPNIIWFIVSFVGAPLYLAATYIMQSKVFSYFAILGFVSLSCSPSATMGLAMMWYFIFVMLLGIIMDVVDMLGASKNFGIMEEPVRQAGDWLALAAFISSIIAFSNIQEFEYVIMFGIVTLQMIINYFHDQSLWRETLLRLSLTVFVCMLTHLIDSSAKPIGLTLAATALAHTLYSFFRISKNVTREKDRQSVESFWLVVSLMSFAGAGALIGSPVLNMMMGWLTGAIVIDIIILLLARFSTKEDSWCLGLIIAGTALPITLLNALQLFGDEAAPYYILMYTIETIGMEALLWKNTFKDGDVLTGSAIVAFGIATLIARHGFASSGLILLIMATAFGVRGFFQKKLTMQEITIYLLGGSVFSFLLDAGNIEKNIPIILGHISFAALLTCSLLFEKLERNRLLIGCLILLILVGGQAIAQGNFAMYLFIIEAVLILVGGILIKQKRIYITGAVGVFAAVLWFTRDLPFVMPVLLGIGIITVVIIMLIFNDKKKTPPKIS